MPAAAPETVHGSEQITSSEVLKVALSRRLCKAVQGVSVSGYRFGALNDTCVLKVDCNRIGEERLQRRLTLSNWQTYSNGIYEPSSSFPGNEGKVRIATHVLPGPFSMASHA